MDKFILYTPKSLSSAKQIVKYLPQAIRNGLPAEIAVVAVSSQKSRALNRRYRKKDKAANVLSFRYSKEYSEILVCTAVIRREARAQKHSFAYQMTWYILHGIIHLSGLHHEASKAAEKEFSRTEQKVLKYFRNGAPRHHHRT